MKVLVTAFEPFGEDVENASAEALRLLLERWDDPRARVVGEVLPVVFDGTSFFEAVARHEPDLVVAIGEAGNRWSVTPEIRAVNDMSARIPDNAGAQPQGVPIVEGAADRTPKVDVERIVDAIRECGLAAEVSRDAGTFVCNFIAFHSYGLDVPAVFIHVPAVRSRGDATVGAETGEGAGPVGGRAPESFDDLADALVGAISTLLPADG